MTTGIEWTDMFWRADWSLEAPLLWKTTPRRVLVSTRNGLFDESVPTDFIWRMWSVMREARQHVFQILTKRPERMAAVVAEMYAQNPHLAIPQNVWLGTSIENQATADERIPHLLRCPAAVRFLSVEPLLGPIVFDNGWSVQGVPWVENGQPPGISEGIDWVIVGGESGPNARPCNIEWIRLIVKQCKEAGVACFVKQLGSQAFGQYHPRRNGPQGGGDMLIDVSSSMWPEDLRVREMPTASGGI